MLLLWFLAISRRDVVNAPATGPELAPSEDSAALAPDPEWILKEQGRWGLNMRQQTALKEAVDRWKRDTAADRAQVTELTSEFDRKLMPTPGRVSVVAQATPGVSSNPGAVSTPQGVVPSSDEIQSGMSPLVTVMARLDAKRKAWWDTNAGIFTDQQHRQIESAWAAMQNQR